MTPTEAFETLRTRIEQSRANASTELEAWNVLKEQTEKLERQKAAMRTELQRVHECCATEEWETLDADAIGKALSPDAVKDFALKSESWSMETMKLINDLTPDILGKSQDPDWFLLRQRLEEVDQLKSEVEALQKQLEEKFAGVLAIRCTKHHTVPQLNKNEHGGGECGACIAEEVEALKKALTAAHDDLTVERGHGEALRRENDKEIGDFQNQVRDLVIARSGAPDSAIDGKGSDAGWQEFTLAEIGQGFAHVNDQMEALRREKNGLAALMHEAFPNIPQDHIGTLAQNALAQHDSTLLKPTEELLELVKHLTHDDSTRRLLETELTRIRSIADPLCQPANNAACVENGVTQPDTNRV
jgi:hypothetical protein